MCGLRGTSRLAARFHLLLGCVGKAPAQSLQRRVQEGQLQGRQPMGVGGGLVFFF